MIIVRLRCNRPVDNSYMAEHHGQASWPQVCRKVGDKQSRTWPEKERIRTEKAKKDLVALMKEQHELAQLIGDAEYKVAECRATKIDKKGTVFFDVSWQGSTRVFGWSPREDFADDEGTIICKPVQEFVCKQERKEKQKNEKEKDKQDRAALKEKQKTERMAAVALVAIQTAANSRCGAASARYCPAEGGSEVAGWPGKSNVRARQLDGARSQQVTAPKLGMIVSRVIPGICLSMAA